MLHLGGSAVCNPQHWRRGLTAIVNHSLRCAIFCPSRIVKGTLISHGEW
jgi:hypothetical protein